MKYAINDNLEHEKTTNRPSGKIKTQNRSRIREYKTFRTIALCFTAAGGAVLSESVSLPVAIVIVAGYAIVAGAVMTSVSQYAVDGE